MTWQLIGSAIVSELMQLTKWLISSLMHTMLFSVTEPYSIMNMNTYSEILKVWNNETPDDFAIFSDFYYQMFGEDFNIPYTTDSTTSSFFPYDWWSLPRHRCSR